MSRIPRERTLLLMLDFDGTLTPIRRLPELAKLNKKTHVLLHNIASTPGIILAFISGRTVQSLYSLTGINQAVYAGEHGIEVSGPGLSCKHSSPAASSLLIKLRRRLALELKHIKGIYIEVKNHSFCVHYRNVRMSDAASVRKTSSDLLGGLIRSGLVRVMHGKKVIEVRPPVRCHKGTAVSQLMTHFKKKHSNLFPIYAGDDISDEEAFKALKGRGLTVHVGSNRHTSADYSLAGIVQMTCLLKKIAVLRNRSAAAD